MTKYRFKVTCHTGESKWSSFHIEVYATSVGLAREMVGFLLKYPVLDTTLESEEKVE